MAVARIGFLIQILLIFGGRCNRYFWDIQLKIFRIPNFNMFFQLVLTNWIVFVFTESWSRDQLMQKLKACFYSTGCKSPRPLLISPNKTLRRCRAYNRQFTALHTFSKYGKWRIIHVVLLLTAVVLAWGQASWGTKSQDAHLASPADFLFLFLYRFWPFSEPCPRPLYVLHSKITHPPTFPTHLLPMRRRDWVPACFKYGGQKCYRTWN